MGGGEGDEGMSKWVVKCRLCGTIYNAYSRMVGDQSVCGECRRKADGR